MTNDENDEEEFGLVVPFVVCESQGGPLDDQAFTVGFELGQMDQEMEFCETVGATPRERFIHAVGMTQLDLIAMRRGFIVDHRLTDDSGEWAFVSFRRDGNDDDE